MLNIQTIELGYFKGDGGVMFSTVPKKYWSRKYPCDTNNMCTMAMRSLLIVTDDKRIIIDPGMGDKHTDKLKFYQPFDLKDIANEVRSKGYAPEEITDVIFTHLHFDHCGGGTRLDEGKNTVLTFPNATYHVSRKQWNNYRHPGLFEKSSFFPENIEPLFHSGKLNFVEKDGDFTPEIRLELYDGHTPGQIVLILRQEEKTIIYPSDVIPTSCHMSLEWLSGYDNNAAVAMEEKKRLIDTYRECRPTYIFYHDAL